MKKLLAALFAIAIIVSSYDMVHESLFGPAPEAARPNPASANQATPQDAYEMSRPGGAADMGARGDHGTYKPPGAQDMGPNPVRYVWQEKLERELDYERFARAAMPAADGGSGDAQYALYSAFAYCRDGLRKRSAKERPLPEDVLRDVRLRCNSLVARYPDLNLEATTRLDQALALKFPRALSESAVIIAALVSDRKGKKAERDESLAVARAQLVEALRTNDPAITWRAADSLHDFFPGDPRAQQAMWVWRLAACEQGMPCGADAEWLRDACQMRGDCWPGQTGAQYIRRAADDLSSLQARARELARTLRKGQLDEAGFAATVMSLPAPRKPERSAAGVSRY